MRFVVSNAPTPIEPVLVATPGGSRALLTIEVDDANAACAQLEAHGVKLLNGPIDRPWGRRTAAFADPAGKHPGDRPGPVVAGASACG